MTAYINDQQNNKELRMRTSELVEVVSRFIPSCG
jgi:hypothetical protein